jgi:hypothetical protein
LPLATRAAVLASGTLVALPLSLLYDLMLGSIAAAWLVRDRASSAARGWEMSALAGMLFALLLSTPALAEKWHLPIFPLAALALFTIAAGRGWRQLRAARAAKQETDRSAAMAGCGGLPPWDSHA